MNQRDMAELTANLIMRYYDNDHMPFLEHMDDEALWYGPAEGQFIKGRDAMIETWEKEDHTLTFTVGDMKAVTNSSHPSTCNVMLTYTVVTHYPSGHDISVYQRILLCWGERTMVDASGKKTIEPRILVCHISNPHRKHDDDVIYPKNLEQLQGSRTDLPHKAERLHFHGCDRSEHFFLSDNILWIEASHLGKHSIIHTTNDDIEVLSPVSELEKLYPNLFIRCHQSYLVNPNYIRNVRRFQVTLTNGVTLPIPEKKYTAFKAKLPK